MKEQKSTNRRKFLKTSAIGTAAVLSPFAMTAKSYNRILGANDTIQVALLGCNRRFGALSDSLSKLKGAKVTYVCDVDARRQEKAVGAIKKMMGEAPTQEKDLRKIVEKDNVDAVFVATPDHWHAAASWMALQNGKHVYVEKPCSHNPREGELLVAYQKEYGKVVQMGNQQRSSLESQEIIKQIHEGAIGEVYHAIAFYSNARGRVPEAKKVAPPDFLDWELFQGPAPRTQFINILEDYMWHWFWNWGTGETGNNATHELDVARWALDVTYPEAAWVNAGKYHFVDDPWVMYDTMEASFVFPGGKLIKWDGKSRNGYQTYGADRGTIIYGSEGNVFVTRNGYTLYDRAGKVVRERKTGEINVTTGLGGGGGLTDLHVHNFLEAIRGKAELHAPIDEGAISTHLTHYANISYKMGNARLEIDPSTGRLKDHKAMKAHWEREYEKGWEPPRV